MFPIQGRIDFPSSWVTTLVNLEPTNLAQVPKKPERLPCHYFREVDEDSLLGLVFSSRREREPKKRRDTGTEGETRKQRDRKTEKQRHGQEETTGSQRSREGSRKRTTGYKKPEIRRGKDWKAREEKEKKTYRKRAARMDRGKKRTRSRTREGS